jgi:hypothetical protein
MVAVVHRQGWVQSYDPDISFSAKKCQDALQAFLDTIEDTINAKVWTSRWDFEMASGPQQSNPFDRGVVTAHVAAHLIVGDQLPAGVPTD